MGFGEFDPTLAFVVEQPQTGIEVRVNFGVYAGRGATPAEIDRLAEWLLDEVGEVSIIAEERHEIDAHVEASVHQVRIEVTPENVPGNRWERRTLERRLVDRAAYWARLCVSERHAGV
jgi:hypothetical protein